MNGGTLKDRMAHSIAQQPGEVLMRSDFAGMGSERNISRALRALLEEGKIVRLGYGVYAKARTSTISGGPVTRVTLEELAQETLIKLGVNPTLGAAQAAYAEGRTTQVPMRVCFNTGKKRITRKISVGIVTVKYENDLT